MTQNMPIILTGVRDQKYFPKRNEKVFSELMNYLKLFEIGSEVIAVLVNISDHRSSQCATLVNKQDIGKWQLLGWYIGHFS